ncbi:hypothetical protein ACTXT7_005544 [Hymenolepis weldensis]
MFPQICASFPKSCPSCESLSDKSSYNFGDILFYMILVVPHLLDSEVYQLADHLWVYVDPFATAFSNRFHWQSINDTENLNTYNFSIPFCSNQLCVCADLVVFALTSTSGPRMVVTSSSQSLHQLLWMLLSQEMWRCYLVLDITSDQFLDGTKYVVLVDFFPPKLNRRSPFPIVSLHSEKRPTTIA